MANVMGSISAGGALVLAPVSAACGVVGLASGTIQLKNGLDTPSGKTDTHLVAKGGTTAFVGGTCMMLGAFAAFVPALCLGAAGVCAAAAIDASLGGLCEKCRSGCQSQSKCATPPSHKIRTTIGQRGKILRPLPLAKPDSTRHKASDFTERLSSNTAKMHEVECLQEGPTSAQQETLRSSFAEFL
jgi:hypothetical protein